MQDEITEAKTRKSPLWGWIILALVAISVGVAAGAKLNQQPQKPQSTEYPSVMSPKSIIAVGDISCPAEDAITATSCQMGKVAQGIVAAKPDAVLLLGDLQYNKGSAVEFASGFAPLWEDLKPISYAVPGNHEYATADAKGYFDYWNGSELVSKAAGDRGKGYYSFDIGQWHIIALNSNCEFVGGCNVGSAQYTWLRDDLRSHADTKCTLAFWHHPRWTSGKYRSNPESSDRSRDFWKLLEAGGAEVVLNGHDHIYERFVPQRADGTPSDTGLREFIVGTGGASQYIIQNPLATHDYGTVAFGYLELELKNPGYDWTFVDSAGQQLDSGTGACNNPYHTADMGALY